MNARQEFPAKIKVAAFERAKKRCERCGAILIAGKFRYNHRIPDALGGQPTLDNCEVLCIACDSAQTYQTDIPAIAKTRRIRKREAGIKKRSSFLTSKDSPYKKKLSGEVVRR
jgi:5-methylcytosine-specific restriction enzyme A